MSDLALVTGATGLLGSYLVEQLLDEGWGVRALVRQPERARWLEENVRVPADVDEEEAYEDDFESDDEEAGAAGGAAVACRARRRR